MTKLLVAVLLAAGCGETLDSVESAAMYIPPTDERCPRWNCPQNSPILGDGIVFDELDRRFGIPSEDSRIKIDSAVDGDGYPITIDVIGDQLRGLRSDDTVLTGGGLVNTILRLHHELHGDYELLIADYLQGEIRFRVAPTSYMPIWHMKARRLAPGASKEFENICIDTPFEPDPDWSRLGHTSVVFEGDHYDQHARLVFETGTGDSRFTIACGNTATAKLHNMRHTYAGRSLDPSQPYETGVEERQALLKLLGADYCGDGTPYTEPFVSLYYQDRNDALPLVIPPSASFKSVEAIWNENGAICLTELRQHRVIARNEVACADRLPPCGKDALANWRTRGYLISVVP